ncbi:MAG: hypothetical protein R6V13_12040 [Anaerolineae bacterium]
MGPRAHPLSNRPLTAVRFPLELVVRGATLLVYGAGRYRFTDSVRIGALLTVLVYTVAIVLVLVFWPSQGPVPYSPTLCVETSRWDVSTPSA